MNFRAVTAGAARFLLCFKGGADRGPGGGAGRGPGKIIKSLSVAGAGDHSRPDPGETCQMDQKVEEPPAI